MPFRFDEKIEKYSLDFELLFKNFEDSKIFDDKKYQELYFKKWKELLKKHDNILINQLNTKEKIEIMMLKVLKSKEGQIFTNSFDAEPFKVTIYFNFRIAPIEYSLEKNGFNKKSITKIDVKEFKTEETDINFGFVENIDIKRPFNKKPIFCITQFLGKHKYLVIDGNHRISHAILLGKKSIDALFIHENSLIQNEAFASSFDKYLYIFLNELNHFLNNKKNNNFSDEKLLSLSFLLNNKVMF